MNMVAPDYLLDSEQGRTYLYPLSDQHGFDGLPKRLGSFTDRFGQTVSIRRGPIGPTSICDRDLIARYQTHVRDIVQNRIPVTTTSQSHGIEMTPTVVLSNGQLVQPNTSQRVVKFSVCSLGELPDFIAEARILSTLCGILGANDELQQIVRIAEEMCLEVGMLLPITTGSETLIMKLYERMGDEEFAVTFYGRPDSACPEYGQQITRRAIWQERGKTDLQTIEAVIGFVA